MNNKTNSTLPPESDTAKPEQVDETRRRLSKAGVAGSGVILTLASRSVLGDWGTCTGSEIMSGNLSKPGTPNSCGCSPEYWGMSPDGIRTWEELLGGVIPAAYAPTALFNTVFGKTYYINDKNITLFQAASQYEGTETTGPIFEVDCETKLEIAMHAVAALLNATVYGDRYPAIEYQTAADVISKFQSAFGLSGNCDTLNAFKDAVDKYDNSTWCFGNQELT
jgi:hypothetical protein